MAAEVRFTQNFEDNLGTIQEFLLARSPDAAVDRFNALLREIAAVAALLSQHPAIGRPMHGREAMRLRIECLLHCDNHLGEGPAWDVEEGCLYWVDGTGRRVGKPTDLAARPRQRTDAELVARPRCRCPRAAPCGRLRAGARRRLLLLRSGPADVWS
jgi:hypothetical protein